MTLSNVFYLTESTEKTATNRNFKFEGNITQKSNKRLYFISVKDYL